jgi:hypothetical protein
VKRFRGRQLADPDFLRGFPSVTSEKGGRERERREREREKREREERKREREEREDKRERYIYIERR